MRPLIGITMGEKPGWGDELRYQYAWALSEGGALPLAIANLEPDLALPLLKRVDGLLLSGGGDAEPRHFGAAALPGLGETEPKRDLFELALVKEAWGLGLPLLGICRGMQLLNVALGGSLWQDRRYLSGPSLPHSQSAPPEETSHQLRIICPALAKILGGQRLAVNSHHHQMLRQVAAPMEIAALSEDGVIEAIWPRRERGFCLGVQWHPERLNCEASRQLFAAFIRAAGEYGGML